MRQVGGLILAAGRVRSKKKNGGNEKNPAASQTHPEMHSSPGTATTSKRNATKHVPRVSPYFPDSIYPGFMEIGLVQLSQSVKQGMRHTQTDNINNGTLYAPRYEEAFLPKAKRPHQLASGVDTGFSTLKSKLYQEYHCRY